MTFLCLYISRWWRQTWDTAPYFTVVNQPEARISTEHGINTYTSTWKYVYTYINTVKRSTARSLMTRHHMCYDNCWTQSDYEFTKKHPTKLASELCSAFCEYSIEKCRVIKWCTIVMFLPLSCCINLIQLRLHPYVLGLLFHGNQNGSFITRLGRTASVIPWH